MCANTYQADKAYKPMKGRDSSSVGKGKENPSNPSNIGTGFSPHVESGSVGSGSGESESASCSCKTDNDVKRASYTVPKRYELDLTE